MSGPPNCFVCSSKFGIFRKQHECKKCLRTACKSCLSYTLTLDDKSSLHSVCKYCYNAAKNSTNHDGRISPPANFKREMARKEEQRKIEAASIPNPVDEQITDRLRKLKESYDRKEVTVDEIQTRLQKLCASEPTVTMEELEYRLAKLKGSRPPAIRVHSIRKRPSSNDAHCSNVTNEGKQVKRLIRQYTDEIAMETGTFLQDMEGFQPEKVPSADPSADDLIELARTELRRAEEMKADESLQDEEIRKRLSKITEAPPVPIEEETLGIHSNFHFDEEGMDEETSQLIRKLLEEDRLEQNLRETGVNLPTSSKSQFGGDGGKSYNGDSSSAIEEELPWCFMCNDDATIRCLTCEDLFCKTCFRVAHKDSDMKRHKTEKFVAKDTDIS